MVVVTFSLHFSLYIFVKESLKFWPIFVCLTHYQLCLACFVKCTKLQYCKNILSLSSFSCKCLHCSNEYFVSLSQGCFHKWKTWYFRYTSIKWMIKKTFVSRIWQTPPLSVCLPSHCIDLAQTLPHHCYNYCPWPTRMDSEDVLTLIMMMLLIVVIQRFLVDIRVFWHPVKYRLNIEEKLEDDW